MWQIRNQRTTKVLDASSDGQPRLAMSLGRQISTAGAAGAVQLAAAFWEALSCDLAACKQVRRACARPCVRVCAYVSVQPMRDDIPTIVRALEKSGKDRTATVSVARFHCVATYSCVVLRCKVMQGVPLCYVGRCRSCCCSKTCARTSRCSSP